MPIQRPATTTATGRRTRHIAAAVDQSCRASSFAVAAMIRSARLDGGEDRGQQLHRLRTAELLLRLLGLVLLL